jgi:hypothetical protein
MRKSFKRAFVAAAALGGASILGVAAIAQTPQTAPQAPEAEKSSPATPGEGADQQRGPGQGWGRGMGRGDRGEGERGYGPGGRWGQSEDGRGMGRGMGRGDRGEGERGYGPGNRWGQNEEGRGMGRQGGGSEYRGGRMGRMSDQDRQAMFEARLAALRAGLMLTPEQEKLWPAVESAVREGYKERQDRRMKMQKEGAAASPIDRMRRMGEMASARGAAMTRFANAAGPLYDSLNDDQKRRLTMLGGLGGRGMGMQGMGMHGMGGRGMGMEGRGGRHEGRGHGHGYRHHQHHGRGGYGYGGGWRTNAPAESGESGHAHRIDLRDGLDRGGFVNDWRRL